MGALQADLEGRCYAKRLRYADPLAAFTGSYIGGNAYDRYDDHGVLVHPYGPHIFHTNFSDIFEYLSRFTAWLRTAAAGR